MLKNKKGKFSFLRLLILIVVIVGVLGGMLFIKVMRDIDEIKGTIVQEVSVQSLREEEVDLSQGEPLNVLLIGTDGNQLERTEAEGFVSRSDTIMIVSLNPETRQTKMLSILRDTLTLIEGYESPDKINHAFAYGGIELSIDTIQKFLNIPIDYYAVIDMSGLEALIDAIGGIEVTSPLTFSYRGTNFVEGETRHVNGVKAMNFARMRYDDPQGEVGRQNRQKLVIKAIIDKLLSLNAVTYYPQILEVVAENIRTNYDLTTILSVYPQYVSALDHISAIQFDTLEEMYIDGVFYFYIPVSSRLKVANELRSNTALPLIQQTALIDPLQEQNIEVKKTSTIVMNQFPSGLTQAQIDEINAAQQEIQSIREIEYYEEPVLPYYPTTIEDQSEVVIPESTQESGQVPAVPEQTEVESVPQESSQVNDSIEEDTQGE